MKTVYLKAGEAFVGCDGELVHTVLGSCVAVCIYDRRLQIGGINHYRMPAPQGLSAGSNPLDYGSIAIEHLLRELKQQGSRREDLQVKIVGGAQVESMQSIGAAGGNIAIAREILSRFGLKIQTELLGGQLGRLVEFNTANGELTFKVLNSSAETLLPTVPEFKEEALRSGLIAIGASTGGPEALKILLRGLPTQVPPMLIVQHMPPKFTAAFVNHLNQIFPFTLIEAKNGVEVLPNNVYLAPGGRHMKVVGADARLLIRITDDPPVNHFKPSVNYLFDSLSKISSRKIVAALLTGMGDDGALGLLKLRNNGAHTLTQEKNSCLVDGMPKAARELGAACEEKPLEEMGFAMVRALNRFCA